MNLSLVKNITTKNVKVSSTAALLDGGRTGKCRTDTLQVAERRKKCWFLDVTASLALELRFFLDKMHVLPDLAIS